MIKYPKITKIILDLADEDGFIEEPIASFLMYIIDQALEVYDDSEKRSQSDYTPTQEDLIGEEFPNFPPRFKIPKYKKSCKRQDRKSFDKQCEKGFPTMKTLTPGLFMMTCACPQKSIYGLAMMTEAESPGMIS